MAQKQDGRVIFADLLRIFAVIAVIVIHLSYNYLSSVNVHTSTWMVLNVYNGLLQWVVPVFVMLSGMFMLDPKRGLPYSKLFFHNILHIVICLAFWGGVYAIVGYVSAGGRFTWWGLWNAILNALKGNTHYHLWFLYIVIGLYLVTPVLRAFVRGAGRRDLHYFFLLCFLFASLLPMAFRLWPGYTAGLKLWYDQLKLHLVMGYVGYYVAGYYLKEYTISRLAEALWYVVGVIGAIVTVWGTASWSRGAGAFTDFFYGYTTPNVAVYAVAIVVLFRYVLGVSDERSRRQRLSRAARISLGVFLVHELFLMLLRYCSITVLSFTTVAAIPLLTALVFLLSYALAWLLSKIPFLGWWLT